jgi:CRP-like cAMP-binding protein
MSQQFLRLYDSGAQTDGAFLLSEGTAYFFINTVDRYSLSGKGMILGATELILSSDGISTQRIETALAAQGSEIKRISREKFTEGLASFPFLMNISIVMAKQLVLTNQLLLRAQKSYSGKEDQRKSICIQYYNIVKDISSEYAKRKLPWLKEFLQKFEISLVCKEGEAHSRTLEPVKIEGGSALSGNLTEYAKDSLLCEEGTPGNEMFILQSGMIDVLIGGKPVAVISEPGTPIGEIALLIGEKRSASLRAKNTVIAAKLQKSDLAEISLKDISVIRMIALSLAKKHYQNVNKIGELTGKIVTKEINQTADAKSRESLKLTAMESELSSLRDALSEMVFKRKEPFLKEIAAKYDIK